MIVYDLRCGQDHTFEAWFRDSAAYEEQRTGQRIYCPVCGDQRVEKALMAPNIARSRKDEPAPERVTKAVAGQVSEQAVKAALLHLREHVEANADYVGEKFPEEARKIHHGETDKRNIYGESTEEEARDLEDEGVEFHRIPWVNHDS